MPHIFQESISDQELSAMMPEGFNGDIVIVDNVVELHRSCEFLASQSVLGFDTETRPSFTKGVMNKVSLLQLSTEKQAFLFRLNRVAMEKPLLNLLSSKDILKAGAAIHDDIKSLQKLRHFTPHGFIDLQGIVGNYGISDKSLRKLAAIVMGIRISKAQRLSNWEASTLTEAQQVYAATDAWVSRQIYAKLTDCL